MDYRRLAKNIPAKYKFWISSCSYINHKFAGLVLPDLPCESELYRAGLTEEVWAEMKLKGLNCEERQAEVYRRIYYGGVAHPLR